MNGSIHTESAFENCNFTVANLFVSEFNYCKMTGSDFAGVQMDGVTLVQGDWSYTNLRQARLAKQVMRGVRFFGADLSNANLEKADLRDCDLTSAIFGKANLQGADLRGANMDGIAILKRLLSKARGWTESKLLFFAFIRCKDRLRLRNPTFPFKRQVGFFSCQLSNSCPSFFIHLEA
ncbi:pentapeptide repeat-containing protein [Paenibacillus sp. V4I5]|uniref:pentapeptide repeat-containing protein n=1 Tax=Paenibacillus sp. V4I5 TaxID=3042306 RepID=UPI00278E8977|nr:pentapeptide repeat-containing protein [Paenibacillus sp. V4I5]MDQ0919561.1 uncharacterized protein YjbI with pentapeptide repeats [Paenibacillus sp. V4I5]